MPIFSSLVMPGRECHLSEGEEVCLGGSHPWLICFPVERDKVASESRKLVIIVFETTYLPPDPPEIVAYQDVQGCAGTRGAMDCIRKQLPVLVSERGHQVSREPVRSAILKAQDVEMIAICANLRRPSHLPGSSFVFKESVDVCCQVQ